MNTHCEGCSADCFPDFIIPFEYWVQISPSGDEHGILCPNCICKRLHEKGFTEIPGAIMSSPIRAVSYDTMHLMRELENITLALEGRRNRWGAALDDRIAEGGINPHRKGDGG